MVGNLSSDGVTIKMLVCGNLKTQAEFKMKTRSQNICCISRRADKSLEQYVTGTNSCPEHPSEPQNRENLNLGPLDPPSLKVHKVPKKENNKMDARGVQRL